MGFLRSSFKASPSSVMHHSSSFHLRKTKSMARDYDQRRLKGHHRLRDLTYIKLADIIKSLRRRRLRRDISARSSSTLSWNFPVSFTDHDSSPEQPPPRHSVPASLHGPRCHSDPVCLPSAMKDDCSAGMSTSGSNLKGTFPDVQGAGPHFSLCPTSAFSTSPLAFRLRSESTNDYLVERLERRLRRLSLGESSSDRFTFPRDPSRDLSTHMHLGSLDVSPRRTNDPGPAFSDWDAQKQVSPHHNQNVVPMILITSVDAKQAKPLPPSTQRPFRTPLSPSNLINHATNMHCAKSERKMILDDPFTTQPRDSAYPLDDHLTFRLPPFPPANSSASKHAPETPTPMCCNHFGDCKGDLWEILHPPLVPGTLTLPPFKLPPLNLGLLSDTSTSLAY